MTIIAQKYERCEYFLEDLPPPGTPLGACVSLTPAAAVGTLHAPLLSIEALSIASSNTFFHCLQNTFYRAMAHCSTRGLILSRNLQPMLPNTLRCKTSLTNHLTGRQIVK